MRARQTQRFLRSCHGVVATEFALMAPLLLILFMGGFEISRFLLVQQKTEKLAYTMADVVTQNSSLTQAQLTSMMNAATEIMKPYTFGGSGIVMVTSVYQNGTVNPPTVNWRSTGGGTLARTSKLGSVGGYATLPGLLSLNDNDNVIVAEVYYVYTPLFSSVVGTQDVYKAIVFKPRLGLLTSTPA